MIYVLSDIHGDRNFKGLEDYISKADDNDLLIILGDVGLSFEKTEENRIFTDFFLSIKKNIAIVDGNHENFDYLKKLSGGRLVRWQGSSPVG